MIRAALALCLALCLAGCAIEAPPDAGALGAAVREALAHGTQSFDHTELHEILKATVKDGLVDYRALRDHRAALDAYLARVAGAPLAALARPHAFTLLINAYNALTLAAILDHPDVHSIREIPGVWDRVTHRVAGVDCTLDQLEHRVLRPLFQDGRVHFAINCASRSCAPLAPYAFDGARLEAQLDERRAGFLADPRNVRVEGGVVRLSAYFDWFRADFTTPGWQDAAPSVLAYVRPRATPAVRAFIDAAGGAPQVRILAYDWSLNASGPPAEPDGWLTAQVRRVRALVAGQGALGPVLFGAVYVLAVVLLVPAGPLTIAAGAVFGLAGGFLVVSACATLAAVLAFLIARHLLRERVRARLARWPAFANVDRAIAHDGGKVVALARLSPVMPFTWLNYALGVTSVGFAPYALATWLATMPGTLLYVAMGAVSVDVATGGAGTGLKVAGVVATALGLWWLTRAATGKLAASAPATETAAAPAPPREPETPQA